MENKKISFGFSKITKKSDLNTKPLKTLVQKIQLIDCLEDKSIKVQDAIEVIDGPLVIPVTNSKYNFGDKVREACEKRRNTVKTIKHETTTEERPDSELSLNELAARELIREAQNRHNDRTAPKIHTIPLKDEKDNFIVQGEEQATLGDYEAVPISEYGLAMMRGMGWNPTKTLAPAEPEMRPKGLGLGANKMVNASKPKDSVDKDGKKLVLVKGGFGKIIAGKHKGQYCLVLGFDDDCRIIVKTALTNNVLTLNDFLLVPVTKEDYALGSKVINNAKYEEFKQLESSSRRRSRSRDRKNSSDSERRKEKKHKKKSSKHKKKSKYRDNDDESERKHRHR